MQVKTSSQLLDRQIPSNSTRTSLWHFVGRFSLNGPIAIFAQSIPGQKAVQDPVEIGRGREVCISGHRSKPSPPWTPKDPVEMLRWEHQLGHKPFKSCLAWSLGKMGIPKSTWWVFSCIFSFKWLFGGVHHSTHFVGSEMKDGDVFENEGASSYAVWWCFTVSVELGKPFWGVPHSRGTQMLPAMATAMLRGLSSWTHQHPPVAVSLMWVKH